MFAALLHTPPTLLLFRRDPRLDGCRLEVVEDTTIELDDPRNHVTYPITQQPAGCVGRDPITPWRFVSFASVERCREAEFEVVASVCLEFADWWEFEASRVGAVLLP